ncbi:CHAT domain-containing protein [Rudaea sp.]|uniref:CHAT domain-containing protein n=1 Tax=Rudaea sp. TaxID=2136325 RepID=UPI002ED1BEB3
MSRDSPRWLRRGLTLLLLLAYCCASVAAPTPLNCRTATATYSLPKDSVVSIDVDANQTDWVEIEESGAELDFIDDSNGVIKVSVPPRYERYFLPVENLRKLRVKRDLASDVKAAFTVRLHCDPTKDERTRIEWYRSAAIITAQLRPVPRLENLQKLLGKIDELTNEASDSSSLALALHIRAQALFSASQAKQSTSAFGQAETAWHNAGDESRALAARLGRVEDLIRAGKYQDASRLSHWDGHPTTNDGYFSHRLSAAGCNVLDYLGELRRASVCYEKAIERFQADGEFPELVNVKLSLAGLQLNLGRPVQAIRQATEARELLRRPGPDDSPVLKGRAEFLLGDAKTAVGDIAGSLRHFDTAFLEFTSANAHRWEANTMLRAASIYAEFGAVDEAHIFLQEALTRLSEQDAPARRAAAQLVLARTEARAGNLSEALRAAHTAEDIYNKLAMPVPLDLSRSIVADLELRAGNLDSAQALIPKFLPNASWTLLSARIALARGNLQGMQMLLHRLYQLKLNFVQQIETAQLESSLAENAKNYVRAQHILRDAALRIWNTASKTDNALLSELLRRRMMPLATQATDLRWRQLTEEPPQARNDVERSAIEDAWFWLQIATQPAASTRPAKVARLDIERFDASIADELLTTAPESTARYKLDATRSLWATLSNTGSNAKSIPYRLPIALDHFQSRMARDTLLGAYLAGSRHGLMLWITHDAVHLKSALAPDDLRDSIAKSLSQISDPSYNLMPLHASLDDISAQLFATVPAIQQPSKLLIWNDSILGSVPWSALRWPGSDTDLVENSTVSIVRASSYCCGQPRPSPKKIHLVISAPQDRVSSRLQALPTAALEDRLIASAIDNSWRIEGASGERQTVLDALRTQGDWVHIASHGQTSRGRVGANGIWMKPSVADSGFLSGLELLQYGVRSDLVVIDACKSAENDYDGIRPALSFADSVSIAGAHDVVAAMWPVSDAAASLWVPAFYGSVSTEPTDIANAMRHAQLRLKKSRAFHHPYFWASWVHLEQLNISN